MKKIVARELLEHASKDRDFQLINPRLANTFQAYRKLFNIHTSHLVTLQTAKKGFYKRRNITSSSLKETFEQSKRNFKHRLCQRGYPLMLVKEILTEVKFTDRKEALPNKTNKRDFTVCY